MVKKPKTDTKPAPEKKHPATPAPEKKKRAAVCSERSKPGHNSRTCGKK